MRSTPPIPNWIREFRHEGYTSIFELLPLTSRLYGTETLFGDWDAQTLLLAQDAAPAEAIRRLVMMEGEAAWRHAVRGDRGGFRTNETLKRIADRLPGGKLYGSAAAHLLSNGLEGRSISSYRQPLTGLRRGELHRHLVRVLAWVVSQMPHVRYVACLGSEAWYLTAMAMDMPIAAKDHKSFRDAGLAVEGLIGQKRITAFSHYHPAAHKPPAVKEHLGWDELRNRLEMSSA